MSLGPPDARYDVVVVGAGQAGAQVALTLSEGGFDGSIGLIGAEKEWPYDRTPLSKGFLNGTVEAADLALRTPGFWATTGVDFLPSRQVTAVDPVARTVEVEHGQQIAFGRLVWAAGGTACSLPVPGVDLDGVHRLRTVVDARALKARAGRARRAVVIGGGYIGLETAASLVGAGLEVSVVESQDRLLARVTSPTVSEYFARRHQGAGVWLHLGAQVAEILGDGGRVRGVRLASGPDLPADLVLLGVGLAPNVAVLEQAGARCANGVDVDEFCRTSLPDVYAAGDCARFPSPFANGERVRLESVQNAVDQAKTVAAALLGEPRPYEAVPWFWSHQYDIKLQTVGLQGGHDEAVVRGDPGSERFSVVYLRQGTVVAVDAINNVRDFAQGKAVVKAGARISPAALSDPSRALKDLVVVGADVC